jgi:hypothetical protein
MKTDHPAPRRRYPVVCAAGEQRRMEDVEEDELAAGRSWLAHVEAGRIG